MQANTGGYSAALRFGQQTAGGTARVWAIEGTGSYGAGLARYLVSPGEPVLEVSRTPRSARRLQTAKTTRSTRSVRLEQRLPARRLPEGVRLSVYQGSRSPKWILNESSAELQL